MKRNIGIFALLLLVLMMLFVSCEAQPELPGNGNDVPPVGEGDVKDLDVAGKFIDVDEENGSFHVLEFSKMGTYLVKLGNADGGFNAETGRYDIADDGKTIILESLAPFVKSSELEIVEVDENGSVLSIVWEDIEHKRLTQDSDAWLGNYIDEAGDVAIELYDEGILLFSIEDMVVFCFNYRVNEDTIEINKPESNPLPSSLVLEVPSNPDTESWKLKVEEYSFEKVDVDTIESLPISGLFANNEMHMAFIFSGDDIVDIVMEFEALHYSCLIVEATDEYFKVVGLENGEMMKFQYSLEGDRLVIDGEAYEEKDRIPKELCGSWIPVGGDGYPVYTFFENNILRVAEPIDGLHFSFVEYSNGVVSAFGQELFQYSVGDESIGTEPLEFEKLELGDVNPLVGKWVYSENDNDVEFDFKDVEFDFKDDMTVSYSDGDTQLFGTYEFDEGTVTMNLTHPDGNVAQTFEYIKGGDSLFMRTARSGGFHEFISVP